MTRAVAFFPIVPLFIACSEQSERDDELLYGMSVEIIERLQDGWLRVRTPYNYESYAHEKYLCFDENEVSLYSNEQSDNGEIRIVTHNLCDVVDGESSKCNLITTLTRGALVNFISCGDKWAKVRLIGGTVGYVRKIFLGKWHREINGNEWQFRSNVVNTAKSYLGTQYRWGGRSPLGIDCSGLCSQSYLMNGVSIYRNARIVPNFPIHEIDRDNIKEGDLIFFPGHVAMYIGGGRYIHSTGYSGGVVINSLVEGEPDFRPEMLDRITMTGSIF